MFVGYIFEAKRLQSYIFETSKLRDASGASELLNALAFENLSNSVAQKTPDDEAAKILKQAGIADRAKIHRRAGGVLSLAIEYAQPEDSKLAFFRALWRLHVNNFAPGLSFADGMGQAGDETDALNAARANMLASPPVSFASIPYASPLVRLAPRSGRAPLPEGDGIKNTTCKISKGEYIDAATAAKRHFLQKGNQVLPRLFADEEAGYIWPVRFDTDEGSGKDSPNFPFLSSMPQRLAIIHIDGNDVGQIFQTAEDHNRRDLSIALEKTTQMATQQAMQETVLPYAVDNVVPARPILLGGDDLTVVLRADLAFGFVREYVKAFEELTAKAFVEYGLPGLKAKAGIVFFGSRQPFAQGYGLCESICSAAKCSKHSSLSFVRLTSSFIPHDAEAIQENRGSLWRQSWELSELGNLQKLAGLLAQEDIGRGAMRRVPELLAQGNTNQASGIYQRALRVLQKRNQALHKELLATLKKFGLNETSHVNSKGYSPLLDAHDIAQIQLEQVQEGSG
jgi:hypothetical protein